MQNIRQYNWLFAFTSMGAHVDNGCGPPVFKISGYLLPLKDETPKFLQLYIYDTSNEVRNRLRCPAVEETPTGCLEPSIVDDLRKMLNHHNPFVKKIRLAKERLENSPTDEFIIRIICAREGDPVQYNLPSTNDLAMLVVGDFSLDNFKRDIIIETRNEELKRILSLHPAYMALQYPLLFPYGDF
jgi:hypothetical protein